MNPPLLFDWEGEQDAPRPSQRDMSELYLAIVDPAWVARRVVLQEELERSARQTRHKPVREIPLEEEERKIDTIVGSGLTGENATWLLRTPRALRAVHEQAWIRRTCAREWRDAVEVVIEQGNAQASGLWAIADAMRSVYSKIVEFGEGVRNRLERIIEETYLHTLPVAGVYGGLVETLRSPSGRVRTPIRFEWITGDERSVVVTFREETEEGVRYEEVLRRENISLPFELGRAELVEKLPPRLLENEVSRGEKEHEWLCRGVSLCWEVDPPIDDVRTRRIFEVVPVPCENMLENVEEMLVDLATTEVMRKRCLGAVLEAHGLFLDSADQYVQVFDATGDEHMIERIARVLENARLPGLAAKWQEKRLS